MFKANNKNPRTSLNEVTEHISHLFLMFFFVEFEQVNVSWVVEILKYKLEIFKAVLLSKYVVKSRSSSFHDNNEIIQRRRKHLSVQSKKKTKTTLDKGVKYIQR